MKKLIVRGIIFLIIAIAPHFIYARNEIPDKVLNNFRESFPAVKNVHWYAFKDYVEAYFAFEKSSCRIDYSLQGQLLVVMYYLTPDLLRKDISTKILTKFPGTEIFGVTEVVRNGRIEYFIALRDNKSWYNVKYTSKRKIKLIAVLANAD